MVAIMRPGHHGSMESVLNVRPRQFGALGWAALFLAVMCLCFVCWGARPWTWIAVSAAAAVTLLTPAVAADLLAVALLGFASYAFALIGRNETLLRRIERDLHDGAQARLIALGISLRATEGLIRTNPEAAVALVAESRENSARALTELRALVRGIHPPVLAERGLGDAIRALALDCPVPATAEVDLPGRLPAPVEAAAYFAVAEALANAAKHAEARSVHIRATHAAGALRIEVSDDGAGGADPSRGTGLRGVERRLGTFDGVLAVSSPPGGPTIVVIEVPCGS